MKFFVLILLLVTIASSDLNKEYQSVRDFWNTIHQVEGSLSQIKSIQPLGPCQPCLYFIQLYQEKLVFHIKNTNRLKPVSCQFKLPLDKVNFLGRQFNTTTTCPSPIGKIFIKFSRNAKNGLEWNYQVSLFDSAIYIKKSQTQYKQFNIFMSFLYNILLVALFPYSRKSIKNFDIQMHGRTFFISLILYMQLVMIIVSYQLVLLCSYVRYQEYYIQKIYSYSFIGICFVSTVIHLGYCFGCLQRQLDQMIPNPSIYKLVITTVLFVGAIVIYPLIICLFPKTLWYFFLCSSGLWIQCYYSISNKIFPYSKFILLYYFNLLFLGVLATIYPCGNFIELAPYDFLILLTYSISSYIILSILLQKKIKVQTGIKAAEQSNFNKRQLDTLGSTQFKTQDLK